MPTTPKLWVGIIIFFGLDPQHHDSRAILFPFHPNHPQFEHKFTFSPVVRIVASAKNASAKLRLQKTTIIIQRLTPPSTQYKKPKNIKAVLLVKKRRKEEKKKKRSIRKHFLECALQDKRIQRRSQFIENSDVFSNLECPGRNLNPISAFFCDIVISGEILCVFAAANLYFHLRQSL